MDKQNYTLSGKEAQEIKGYYSHLECTFAEVTDCHGGENLQRFSLEKGALYFAD